MRLIKEIVPVVEKVTGDHNIQTQKSIRNKTGSHQDSNFKFV